MFRAVLDACALFPQSLRDVLLRIARAGLFTPVWSARILEEMRRSIVEDRGVAADKAERTVRLMREVFEEAEIDERRITALTPAMTNDAKDRHVLATAVAAGADLVVTFNISDFPTDACTQHGIEATTPDTFLLDLFDLDADDVYRVLAELVGSLTSGTTFDQFLEKLERAGVPEFVGAVRDHQARRLAGG